MTELYFQKLCILCLQNSINLKNVYSKDCSDISIIDKVNFTIDSLQRYFLINDDYLQNMPMYICEDCDGKVNNMYVFKQQCLRNINDLATYINQQNKVNLGNISHLSYHVKGSTLHKFYDAISEGQKYQSEDNETLEIYKNELEKDTKPEDITLPMHMEENITNIKTEEIYIKSEIDEDTLQTHVEENVESVNNEEKVDIDYELFDKQIATNRTQTKLNENKKSKVMEYKCSVCLKIFRHQTSLTKHMRIHTGVKPYKCSFCMKAFNQHNSWSEHIRIHTGEKPFKCNVCLKSFRHQNTLRTHVRIHTGEKPFKCNVCPKAFCRQYSLTIHTRIHTGEAPYQCKICFKEFRQGINLSTHMKVHKDRFTNGGVTNVKIDRPPCIT